jgi:dTDP-glucose 4,6-dehydratase
MKTVMVAGGAGFIGANFVRIALAKREWRIVVFDKLTYSGSRLNLQEVEKNPRYTFVLGDITDREALQSAIERLRPQIILNFAAETHVDRSIDSPRVFLQTNVVGAFQMLEAARDYWEQLNGVERQSFRYLHVSTDEVYGSLSDGSAAATEDGAYAPNSPYAASKASADHFARAYRETYGLPVLTTNCSNNYGYYQFPEKLIPLAIGSATGGKPIPIYGDGLNVRDWIFVQDHCEALIAVLERGQVGTRYNIGANCERTNLALIGEICAILDELSPPNRNPVLALRDIGSYGELITFVPDRPGHDRRYALDSTRIRRELGWKPRRSFEEGLRATVHWYLTNREWCESVQRGRYSGERLGLSAHNGPDTSAVGSTLDSGVSPKPLAGPPDRR